MNSQDRHHSADPHPCRSLGRSGCCRGSSLTLPYMSDKRDIEYFVTRQDTKDDSETLQRQVKQSRATVGPYLKAGKVVLINENGEVIAGITLLSEPGHTPGHTAYLQCRAPVTSCSCGATLFIRSEVQFEHP